jgi:hypothetical protein
MCQASSLSLIDPSPRYKGEARRVSLFHAQTCPKMSPASLLRMGEKIPPDSPPNQDGVFIVLHQEPSELYNLNVNVNKRPASGQFSRYLSASIPLRAGVKAYIAVQ